MMDIFKLKKLGLFAGGVLFGTAGVKILGSEDAKKFYVNCVAAGLPAPYLCYFLCLHLRCCLYSHIPLTG